MILQPCLKKCFQTKRDSDYVLLAFPSFVFNHVINSHDKVFDFCQKVRSEFCNISVVN